LKISLDVDSVLADVMVVWLEIYNWLYGKSLRKTDVTSWDFWVNLGIGRHEFEDIFTQTWVEWERIPPTESGLSEKVDALRSLGCVDIVTGRSLETLPYIKKWLDAQNIRYDGFVRVPSSTFKGELEYDVFIDDSPHNALSAADNGRCSILYDQPWNRDVARHPNIHRVEGLGEAIEVVKRLKLGKVR